MKERLLFVEWTAGETWVVNGVMSSAKVRMCDCQRIQVNLKMKWYRELVKSRRNLDSHKAVCVDLVFIVHGDQAVCPVLWLLFFFFFLWPTLCRSFIFLVVFPLIADSCCWNVKYFFQIKRRCQRVFPRTDIPDTERLKSVCWITFFFL